MSEYAHTATDQAAPSGWRQPARCVALAGCLVAVALMLAVIASVAQQQRQRGHSFEFANVPAQPAPSAPYAMRGARMADLNVVDGSSLLTTSSPR